MFLQSLQKSNMHKVQRVSCPVGLPQLSLNITNSMCATRTSRDSSMSEHFVKTQSSGFFTQRDQGSQLYERPINPLSQLVPGIKFGRYFGSLEEATERHVARKISERTGVKPTQVEVATETVRGLSKGRQFTASERILIKKIDQIEKKVNKYMDMNEKMRKENDQLREHNKSLRTLSDIRKKKMNDFDKENNHLVLKTKMVTIHNQAAGGKNQIRVSRIQ